MMTQLTRDLSRAQSYFEDKLAFTTGPVELNQMIQSGEHDFNVIDVREAEDYAKGHIPTAINLPRDQWSSLQGLSKEKLNIIYCYTHVCHLGAKACALFAKQGYPVMELEGGFEQWKENDLDVEGSTVNRLMGKTEKLFHRRH